jgi:vacuolar-type H+-ATPase subunit H
VDIFFSPRRFLSQLDEDKAETLAQLEKDLNIRQEQILESARKRIDALNEEANRLKIVKKIFLLFFFSKKSFE